MKTFLNFLTVTTDVDFPFKEDMHTEINREATKMINFMKNKIKEHKCVQKDLDLIYVLDQCNYKLPLQFSEKHTKTKWEAFALKKGIKKKKGSLVYDEELKKYVPRFGSYSKKNLVMKSALVEGEKSFSDLKREKKDRVKKNEMKKIANKKRK